MNYNNKKFRLVKASGNSELSNDTVFNYHQHKNILTCDYHGAEIVKGHLIGKVDNKGNIDIRYHQINLKGELMTGICKSKPEILSNCKVRLFEQWKWTSGSCEEGQSIIEEI